MQEPKNVLTPVFVEQVSASGGGGMTFMLTFLSPQPAEEGRPPERAPTVAVVMPADMLDPLIAMLQRIKAAPALLSAPDTSKAN